MISSVMTWSNSEIRKSTSELLRDVWMKRSELDIPSEDPIAVLHIAPRYIAERILLLQIRELAEIPPSPAEQLANVEVAGVLNRLDHTIYVSRKFRTVSRRFTLAHEIGHFIMHPGLELHRDRPLDGRFYTINRRSETERQADYFAAELLMPERLLTAYFNACFGKPVFWDSGDDALIYKLAVGTGRTPGQTKRLVASINDTALLIATTMSFGHRPFESLSSRFAVSPTAMAIQLLELGLLSPQVSTVAR